MSITLEFPKGVEPLDYITSFAPAFAQNENMRSSLLGMRDSLRQAELLPSEPLGMLACLTAEEEAASFLYYALLHKDYAVKNYGKLQRHGDKIKVLIIAQVLYEYFFKQSVNALNQRVRLERDGDRPLTSRWMTVNEFEIMQEDPLETIIVVGEGDAGHNTAVDRAVQEVLQSVVPKGIALVTQIKALANRRNLCLYGDPEKKTKLDASNLKHFTSNSIAITVLGFLVFNGQNKTLSMNKLVETISQKLSSISS